MFRKFFPIGMLVFPILITPNDGKFSADFQPCKAEDEQCLIQAINKVIETKYRGDPSLNLVSIDPLKIDKMEIKQPKNNPVSIDITFRNSEVIGYKDFRAYKVRGFGASPEGKHEVYLKGPFATLKGDYTVDGKVLFLPIRGEGRSNITLDNVFLKIYLNAGSKVQDGATYMDVKNVKLNLNTTQVHFDLSNLFNGDKALGDNLNQFLNENWHSIYTEIKQSVLNGFAIVYTDVLKKFFTAHPYSELVDGGKVL